MFYYVDKFWLVVFRHKQEFTRLESISKPSIFHRWAVTIPHHSVVSVTWSSAAAMSSEWWLRTSTEYPTQRPLLTRSGPDIHSVSAWFQCFSHRTFIDFFLKWKLSLHLWFFLVNVCLVWINPKPDYKN